MSTRSDNFDDPVPLRRAGEAPRHGLLDRVRGLLGLGPVSVREDIEDKLEESAGDVTPHERTLLKNVLGLHDMRVEDAMIPRADIVAISIEASLREALELFRTAGHSRLPVYAETLDDPRGMVHIRDFVVLIGRCADKQEAPDAGAKKIDFDTPLAEANLLKNVLFVPRSMPALDLLIRMQTTHIHLALVIDEYGGTDGLVTIEDIMEMIVGDIEDEHDVVDEPGVVELDNGDYFVDGRADLDEVTQRLGVDFRLEDTPAEVTTLGGLVAWLAGRVPMRGEIIPTPAEGYEFEIVDADPRRVGKLRVRAKQSA
ncbi:hemolysin family protein [Methylocystis sp. 9N]|uniref:Hemolysin family protein n=1 Tax=Methylocystis borbori TaxID=3118750 RepID=A0ABU7XG82_9HYPH